MGGQHYIDLLLDIPVGFVRTDQDASLLFIRDNNQIVVGEHLGRKNCPGGGGGGGGGVLPSGVLVDAEHLHTMVNLHSKYRSVVRGHYLINKNKLKTTTNLLLFRT